MGQAGSQEAPLPPPDIAGGVGSSQPMAEQRTEALVVPTVLQWSTGGTSVYVTGSFNNWGERIPLRRSGADFVVCLNLLPGTYQYKFIVDSEWRFAPDQPTVRDEMGNINNCVTVEDQQMYLHEDPCSGFFGDNPNNAYTQVLPDEITLAKEPPLAPVHLTVIPMNNPAAPMPSIASWSMQPPQSVTLLHMCLQRTDRANVSVVSTTQRFRSKFVTIVIYKPFDHSRDGWPSRGAMGQQQQQLLAAPQARVSWSGGGEAQAGGAPFGTSPGFAPPSMAGQMLPPPVPQRAQPPAPANFSHQLSSAESMDLGSRAASQSANMDTSADWHIPDASP
ncbi:hypothetical protein AB1Y20_016648 [Prymnesium parvum]|uniref:Association with the SNF1 complex (ASC) domain-containing protein n=1 Tax=Prymnesium parvum TaxID=97485 RepID=A0AB34IDC8_PRYPA